MEALKKNGYPLGFLKQCIRRAHRTKLPSTSQQPPDRIHIPYVEGQSEAIRRILHGYNITTSFTPRSTLKESLTHLKDPIPPAEQSGVVYSISCACCDHHYIGETGRNLKTREEEHRTNVKKGEIEKSGIAEHAWICGHQIDWTSTKILGHQ